MSFIGAYVAHCESEHRVEKTIFKKCNFLSLDACQRLVAFPVGTPGTLAGEEGGLHYQHKGPPLDRGINLDGYGTCC